MKATAQYLAEEVLTYVQWYNWLTFDVIGE